MRVHLTTLLVITGALNCSPAAAFSPLPPQRRDIVSPNGRFVLDADPKAGVNTVYSMDDRSTPLWSFPGTLWLADALLSNDGAVVVVVQAPFVKVEHLDEAGAVWFQNRDGVFLTYTMAELCPSPRPTASLGFGPVGSFWRTWRVTDPRVTDSREEFEVETTSGWTYTFRLADGAVTGRRLNDWVVYRRWFWAVVLGVPAAGLTGFVARRRRRPTWPRERHALMRAGVSSAATLTVALLASLRLAAWVEGGDDYSRRDGLLRAIHRSQDAWTCWYAGIAVSVTLAVAVGLYTFIWVGLGRVRSERPGFTDKPALSGGLDAPCPPTEPA